MVTYVLLAVALLSAGCSADEDIVAKQEENIEKYLSSNALEYVYENGVYKYIASRTADATAVEAQKGDSVVFRFAGYTFGSAPAGLFYTNNRYLVEGDTLLNTTYWSFEPKRVKLGDGSIIKGLEKALLNSMQGDSLLVFMTSEMGYGDKAMGAVDMNTALMYVLNIESVKR